MLIYEKFLRNIILPCFAGNLVVSFGTTVVAEQSVSPVSKTASLSASKDSAASLDSLLEPIRREYGVIHIYNARL